MAYGHRGVEDLVPRLYSHFFPYSQWLNLADTTLEYDIKLVSFDYTQVEKPKTARERIEERRKAERQRKINEQLQGELQPDGSRIVNFRTTGDEDEDTVIELWSTFSHTLPHAIHSFHFRLLLH